MVACGYYYCCCCCDDDYCFHHNIIIVTIVIVVVVMVKNDASLLKREWQKMVASLLKANGKYCGCAQIIQTEAYQRNNNNNDNRIERHNSRFLAISSLRHELSPTRTLKWPGRNHVQITCNTPDAYHLHPAVFHLVRRDSSAVKLDRVEITFILALFYWLKPLTDEELDVINWTSAPSVLLARLVALKGQC